MNKEDSQTTVQERIRAIANEFYKGNITAMARATFISRTTINSIIGEQEVSPGFDVIRRIGELSSPKISMEWLITGKGNMLKTIEPATDLIVKTRPRVPLTAAAGFLTEAAEGVTLKDCEHIPIIPQMPSYDFTIFLKGDSLYPKYESGDEVACKRVDQTSFIQWGKLHVLDTSQGIIAKRIYEDGSKIRCVSYNSEYPDFSIDKKEIYSISIVVGLVRI